MTVLSAATQIEHSLADFFAASIERSPDESGYEVIVSPFLYPDRDSIEIFVEAPREGQVRVSDLGQTMIKLSTYGFELADQPHRRAMIKQITGGTAVKYEDGNFSVVGDPGLLGERAWELLVVLQRVSDLVFTMPGSGETFGDEIAGLATS